MPIARTRDDAPGEAFDKVARRAGLGYPGGPVVDRIAARGDGEPLPASRSGRAGDGSHDFSFSGLKTAMLREFEKRGVDGVAARSRDAPARPRRPPRVLPARDRRGAPRPGRDRAPREGIRALALSGGVAANSSCGATLSAWGAERGVPVLLPERALTTDNAAMIALAGLLRYRREGADELPRRCAGAIPVAARELATS